MILALIKDGLVHWSVTSNSIDELKGTYPEYEIVEHDGTVLDNSRWDGVSFIPPEAVESTSGSTKITQFAFLNRFTNDEAVLIDLASQGATVEAASLRQMQRKFDAAKYIDLLNPATQYAVNLLEQLGFLAPGRSLEILSTNISPEEYY